MDLQVEVQVYGQVKLDLSKESEEGDSSITNYVNKISILTSMKFTDWNSWTKRSIKTSLNFKRLLNTAFRLTVK